MSSLGKSLSGSIWVWMCQTSPVEGQWHVTGLGLGFQWKGQKEKGLLPAGSVEPGSSTNVLRGLLELAQQGVAGNAQRTQLTNLAPRGRQTLCKKCCVRPLLVPDPASLGFGPLRRFWPVSAPSLSVTG